MTLPVQKRRPCFPGSLTPMAGRFSRSVADALHRNGVTGRFLHAKMAFTASEHRGELTQERLVAETTNRANEVINENEMHVRPIHLAWTQSLMNASTPAQKKDSATQESGEQTKKRAEAQKKAAEARRSGPRHKKIQRTRKLSLLRPNSSKRKHGSRHGMRKKLATN
jgi:hypothetical protein